MVNRVFNGATGWNSDPTSGLRELSGVELAQMKRGSDFYAELNYKKHYGKMEVKGKEKVGSYETYVIEGAPPKGAPKSSTSMSTPVCWSVTIWKPKALKERRHPNPTWTITRLWTASKSRT